VFAVLAAGPRQRRIKRLAATRDAAAAYERFCRVFPELSDAKRREIYESLQRLVGCDAFPVEVEDNLWTTLELDQGNVESEVESFYERQNRQVPTFSTEVAAPATVRDLVSRFYMVNT